VATAPEGDAGRARPNRWDDRSWRWQIGILGIVLVAAITAIAIVSTASHSGPAGQTAASSPATASASASSAVADFRFLPALVQPPIEPPPSPPPSAPSGRLTFGLAAGADAPKDSAPVWIGWIGVDGAPLRSGVTVSAGVDRGTSRKLPIRKGATRILQTIRVGRDYVVRLDVKGSSAASATSSAVAAVRLRSIDDRDSSVSYSGQWALAGFPGYVGGSARFSTRPGSVASFTFIGRSVAWVGPVGPARGRATVQVDGASAATVSQAAARYRPRHVLFARSWPAVGRHTVRITVVGAPGATVMIDSFNVIGEPARQPVQPATPPPFAAALPSASLPLRAAFYYGWYPEAWSLSGSESTTTSHPTEGRYDAGDPGVVAGQIQAMRYGGIRAGIASWWGPLTRTDGRMPLLLTSARGTGVSWAVNDEVEEVADLDPAAIANTLRYVADHYANDPAYLRIGGRFVVFVGAGPTDGCDMVERWTTANTVRAYLVLPAVPGHESCASQPDQWYGSDPTVADLQVGSSSYAISAAFWRSGEPARLQRDPARWAASIQSMIASGARLQLIESFNQCGDGSSVESASEWASASGYGAYLDALHDAGGPAPSGGPPGGDQSDAVLVGAGAIASCASTNDEATAQILSTVDGTVFTVGDNAFDAGTIDEYRNCYAPSWGAFRDRTRPAAGSREYGTAGAAGYFGYFGSAAGPVGKGYYAYELGSWRIYVLNSNCSKVGGCGAGSPQERWLRADLAAHPRTCIGAYWQTARFSSGRFKDDAGMQPFWQDLYDHGAEFVINGRDHNYQRFAPMTPSGSVDAASGIREFIVGTGGNGHTSLGPDSSRREAASDQAYGVLRLTLHPSGYEWQFLATAKAPYDDAGAQSCH